MKIFKNMGAKIKRVKAGDKVTRPNVEGFVSGTIPYDGFLIWVDFPNSILAYVRDTDIELAQELYGLKIKAQSWG